jgi:AraC-like DNA-binding protein
VGLPGSFSLSVPSDKQAIAYARFPGLIRDAVRDFRQQTGFHAVTTLGTASADPQLRGLPSPPVHPRCAELLKRETPRKAPCDAEWRKHLRSAAGSESRRTHTCPLGLRCAGIPILVGDELLGLAKFVCGPELSKDRFHSLVSLLEALVARPCQDLHILLLQDEIQALQTSVDRLQRIRPLPHPAGRETDRAATEEETPEPLPQIQSLIRHVLDYLGEHHADCELTLGQVAGAVGRNPKYVTHLFVQQVGERMRTYITTLRVRHACELLLHTGATVEQIARDSGFAHPAQFRQSFRRTIGVTASEYRQAFTAGNGREASV